MSHCSATRGLLATDNVILNHGQVTWTTPELAPPLLTTTPHQRQDVSALDRFNVPSCPTRRVFSGTGIELVTKQAMIRYLYHSATAAPYQFRNGGQKVDFSRGDRRNRGSSENFSRGDRRQSGRLNVLKVFDDQNDQTQSANYVPIKLSAICMSSVELPNVPILLNDTFTKAL
ncbi:uncharacterized protein TNCV_2647251 [Trichonephila clavipes]|nr:uncharacterized protein TNCV_2647251 [Trichonephila clavipes]